MAIKRQRKIKVLKTQGRVRVKIKWLIIAIIICGLLHVFVVNGIYIMNFTQSTLININVGDTDGAYKDPPMRQLLFYDHPVLRRIDGVGLFYLSAIADKDARHIDMTPLDSVSKMKLNFKEAREGDHYDVNDDVQYYHQYDQSRYTDYEDGYLDYSMDQTSDKKYFNVRGIITFNGWEFFRNHKDDYYCCYKYPDNRRNVSPVLKKNIWDLTYLKIINAVQVICPLIPGNVINAGQNVKMPSQVALSATNVCRDTRKARIKYIKLEEKRDPPKGNNSIAVCSKIIYNDYPAGRLVEWFEFNKLMGVDKVMMFRFNVSREGQKVLDHYETEGFLETIEYDYPMKKSYLREPGGKNVVSFNDEQVTVFDCLERFRDYDFVTVLDVDEFLVPTKSLPRETWKTMLDDLMYRNPSAAGFSFHTQIFTLDWGVSNKSSGLFVTKYIQRTRTMWDRKKNIVIPSRVQRGSVWTHDFNALKSFTKHKVTSQDAIIFHYRKCRHHWILSNSCMKNRARIRDIRMAKVMSSIQEKIKRVKKNVLGVVGH